MRYLVYASAVGATVLYAACVPTPPRDAPNAVPAPPRVEFATVREMTPDGYIRLVRHDSGRCFIASRSTHGYWVYSQVDREMCAEPAK